MAGKIVQEGIAIGRLQWVKTQETIGIKHTGDPERAVASFETLLETAAFEIAALEAKARDTIGEEEAQIFQAHQMILQDPVFIDSVRSAILEECFAVDSAVEKVFDETIAMFENIDDPYLKQRALDIKDIKRRLLNIWAKSDDEEEVLLAGPVILIADEITPSDTLGIPDGRLVGMLMKTGGETSHTAILAQSLGIPAMVGCGNALDALGHGDEIVLDALSGQWLINPSHDTITLYREKQDLLQKEKEELKQYVGLPSMTRSGQKIEIAANIAGPEDLKALLENDAEGVGLFRTEFIYMNRTEAPAEEEQYEIYKQVLEGMSGKTIIFRTMDIGGDKEVAYLDMGEEANPFLGYRAIRYCLEEPEIFKTQIRAILRAAVHGKAKIMFPMIASVEEFVKAKSFVDEVRSDLAKAQIVYSHDVPLGIMVEIPSAAILVEDFAEHVDFFSIGTNDLTQYTLAVDRQNSKIASLYDYMHPAVLALIERVVTTAKRKGKWVGMCGNAAADTRMIEKLILWGIDEISVAPGRILKSRKFVRNLS
ncbi:MAG: phosphoenolpyruvate--protein phosphotransferase [Clostridia bacterium]|nr:phosphoenolpyruvate--protein phosphotransferase [Clostridia bacterium]